MVSISLSEGRLLHKSQSLLFFTFQIFLTASHIGAVDSKAEACFSLLLAFIFACYTMLPKAKGPMATNPCFLVLFAAHIVVFVGSCLVTIGNFPQVLPMRMMLVGCYLLVHLIFITATFWMATQREVGKK